MSKHNVTYSPELLCAYAEFTEFAHMPIEIFASEFWNKGINNDYVAHGEAQRSKPYAESVDPIVEHKKNMQRVAMHKVSTILKNKSHSQCKELMRDKQLLSSAVTHALINLPGCPDPIKFLKQQGVQNPAQRHQEHCEEILQSISAVWSDYKNKRIKSHNPEKFRRHFAKNINNQELVSAYIDRKNSVGKAMPALEPVRKSMPNLVKTQVPSLRALDTRTVEKAVSDMPRLVPRVESDMPRLVPRVESDMPRLVPRVESDMPRLVPRVESDMPRLVPRVESETSSFKTKPIPKLVPLNKPVSAAMPGLNRIPRESLNVYPSKVSSNMPGLNSLKSSKMPTLKPVSQATPRLIPINSTRQQAIETRKSKESAVGIEWLRDYISKNVYDIPTKDLVYFCPSNRRVAAYQLPLKSMGAFTDRKKYELVEKHLFHDPKQHKSINGRRFSDINGNNTIEITQSGKLSVSSGKPIELQSHGSAEIAGVNVRIFMHDDFITT
jgi:hypothetical protein